VLLCESVSNFSQLFLSSLSFSFPTLQELTVSLIQQPVFINDGFIKTFTVTHPIHRRVDWVEIYADIEHERSGDLEISIVSPSGTESVLAEARVIHRIDPTITSYCSFTALDKSVFGFEASARNQGSCSWSCCWSWSWSCVSSWSWSCSSWSWSSSCSSSTIVVIMIIDNL